MKKIVVGCILCNLIAFNLTGCGGITISFNSDDKSKQNETKQDQNVDDSAAQKENEQNQNENSKSTDKDQQGQNEKDNSSVTVNITSDTLPTPEKKDIIIIRDQIPTNLANGGFIFENSNYAYLTKNQVSELTNFQLGIARNEIYARHGYIFSLEQFRSYFNAQNWYRPTTTNVALNSIETYNVDLIKAEENRRGIKWN